MANRVLIRTLLSSANQTLIPRSFTTSYFLSLRPVVAIAAADSCWSSLPATDVRAFSTRQTTSSLNDSNPNWSNRPPKETILLDGCDFEHWLVVLEKPEGEPTRDEIIESYINTLAKVVGSYDEARMKIYSVSTKCYFAFGALVSEELSYKLKELPGVRWVLPDSYLDVKNKDYGGEPFIDGKAVPYDPKYHEEWIRNNARANDRNRKDRPRNFDRPRNYARRQENMQSNRGPPNNMGPPGNMGPLSNRGPPHNMGPLSNRGPPHNMGPPSNHGPPHNMGPTSNLGPPNNMGPPSNLGPPNNMGPPSNLGPPNNMGPPSNLGPPNNMGPPSNLGPPNNMGPPVNMGPSSNRGPPNMAGGPPKPNNWNGLPSPPYNGGPPNMGESRPQNGPNYQQQGRYGPNSYQSGPGPNCYQSGPGPNSYQSRPGPNSYQSGPGPNSYPPNSGVGNPYQTQDVPGRDMPPAANYE